MRNFPIELSAGKVNSHRDDFTVTSPVGWWFQHINCNFDELKIKNLLEKLILNQRKIKTFQSKREFSFANNVFGVLR